MANLINLLECITVGGGNTRIGNCVSNPGILSYGALIPHDHDFTLAQTATMTALQTALIALAQNDSSAARGFLLGRFENVEAAGEDRQQETAGGSGNKRTVRQAKVGFRATIWNGGPEYHQTIFSFNGKQSQYDLILFDENGLLIGTYNTAVDGTNTLAGFTLADLYVSPYVWPNGSAGGSFTVEFQLSDATQINERRAIINTTFDPYEALQGLFNVHLTGASPSLNLINVTATVNGVDAKPTYGAALAQAGAWIVTNAKPGSADYGDEITVASVAQTGTGWALTIAATGVDTDNPGTGQNVKVALRANSVLAGLTTPVLNLESDVITVTLF